MTTSPSSSRWLLVGLVLLPVLASCRPSPGTVYPGNATYYSGPAASGACGFSGETTDLFVAINSDQFAGSQACGGWLSVTGPDGTVQVLVTDECPGCGENALDLSPAAFDAIADPLDGTVPVSWELLSGGDIGNIDLRVVDGSNEYYLAVRVENTRNLVKSVEIELAGTWQPMTRETWNAFTHTGGPLSAPVNLRITDIWDEQIVQSVTTIAAGVYPGASQFAAH